MPQISMRAGTYTGALQRRARRLVEISSPTVASSPNFIKPKIYGCASDTFWNTTRLPGIIRISANAAITTALKAGISQRLTRFDIVSPPQIKNIQLRAGAAIAAQREVGDPAPLESLKRLLSNITHIF